MHLDSWETQRRFERWLIEGCKRQLIDDIHYHLFFNMYTVYFCILLLSVTRPSGCSLEVAREAMGSDLCKLHQKMFPNGRMILGGRVQRHTSHRIHRIHRIHGTSAGTSMGAAASLYAALEAVLGPLRPLRPLRPLGPLSCALVLVSLGPIWDPFGTCLGPVWDRSGGS